MAENDQILEILTGAWERAKSLREGRPAWDKAEYESGDLCLGLDH